MTRGDEIVQRMIEAAGLENEEDMAAMFGVEETWIRDVLPGALEFFKAYCDICEQDLGEILGFYPPQGKTGRIRGWEGYFTGRPDHRIGVAAGVFKAPDIVANNGEIAEMFASAQIFEAAAGGPEKAH